MKFDTGDFCENMLRNSRIWFKSDNSIRHLI